MDGPGGDDGNVMFRRPSAEKKGNSGSSGNERSCPRIAILEESPPFVHRPAVRREEDPLCVS
jgi:hypothetical protein